MYLQVKDIWLQYRIILTKLLRNLTEITSESGMNKKLTFFTPEKTENRKINFK